MEADLVLMYRQVLTPQRCVRRERGVLRVGTAGDYQPMSYYDPEAGAYVGFDAELAEDLPNAELIIHDVDQEISGLVASGEADVMITEIMEAGYYVGQDDRLHELADAYIYRYIDGADALAPAA